MTRWSKGEGTIELLLREHHLERLTGAAANAEPWFRQADRRLATATHIFEDDPESAFVLAYDAARFAAVALLAQQGLRPTQAGGHVAICDAVKAQFAGPFVALGTLRRRRNELEYPAFPGEHVEVNEVSEAIEAAQALLQKARAVVPHLGLFG